MSTAKGAVIAIILAACTASGVQKPAANDPAEAAAVRRAIDSTNAAMTRYIAQGHSDSVALQYTEDARWVDFGEPTLNGRQEIATAIEEFVRTKAEIKPSADQVNVSGWIAVERGSLATTYTPPGPGEPVKVTGNYLVEWHKVGNQWLRANDFVVPGRSLADFTKLAEDYQKKFLSAQVTSPAK